MKIMVLGAGIIGTSSAWFLNKAGHDVCVIERQPGVAQETSFANGGQIAVSHAEPWANPHAPFKLLKYLGKDDAPLLFRPRAELQQWLWGLSFLRECSRKRTDENIRQILALSEYSRKTLLAVRKETGLSYDNLSKGILHFYTNQQEFERSLHAAKLMRELGCPRNTINADEVVKKEPALSSMRHKIVGGDYTETDESGDAHKFTCGLAQQTAAAGVAFRFNTSVTRLLSEGSGACAKIIGVEVIDETGQYKILHADAYVVAIASFAPQLLRPLGINLMIYPGKGYSATYPIVKPDQAPCVSLTDDGYKLVISRLGERLRVAGTCEINGYSRELNTARCLAITRRTRELFPDACCYENPIYWSGLRPLTPSNRPYIGKTKFHNLYLNVGHGSLGWTMGAGSGRAISEIIGGSMPEVAFKFSGL
ncbi:D-amino acid dehydrogenase [Undibacterium sp. Ren11W]|uniref:D-amino acid dehydrogenase n=1 Tax=Undibacterium sp. Ren11W TaxID=3413045 RepID=UPI003BF24E95